MEHLSEKIHLFNTTRKDILCGAVTDDPEYYGFRHHFPGQVCEACNANVPLHQLHDQIVTTHIYEGFGFPGHVGDRAICGDPKAKYWAYYEDYEDKKNYRWCEECSGLSAMLDLNYCDLENPEYAYPTGPSQPWNF